MSQACLHQPRARIQRTFEANRLAQDSLNEAYEKIVPIYIRIVSRQKKERPGQRSRVTTATVQEGRIA